MTWVLFGIGALALAFIGYGLLQAWRSDREERAWRRSQELNNASPVEKDTHLKPFVIPPPPTPAPKNGYKGFKWGDSVAAVKAKGAADLDSRGEGGGDFDYLISDSYLYFNGNNGSLMREVNPVEYFKGSLVWYESKALDARFLFLNQKLAAVRLSFMSRESLAPNLEAQYGPAPSAVVADSEIRAWRQEPGRIILWRVVVAGLEEVFYLDSEVYSALERRALQERAKLNPPKPVLD